MDCWSTDGWQRRTRDRPRPLECTHTRFIRRTRPECALCAGHAGCTGTALVGCIAALQASARLAKGLSRASCNMSWRVWVLMWTIRALPSQVAGLGSAASLARGPVEGCRVGGNRSHRRGIVGHGRVQTSYRILYYVHIWFMVKNLWSHILMDGHILLKLPSRTVAKTELLLRFCPEGYIKPI